LVIDESISDTGSEEDQFTDAQEYLTEDGKCKSYLFQIQTINTFVERLGTMALNIYIWQRKVLWKAGAGEKPLSENRSSSIYEVVYATIKRVS
jgi:hypothetical protein